MPETRGVIWDMDGVIVNTLEALSVSDLENRIKTGA